MFCKYGIMDQLEWVFLMRYQNNPINTAADKSDNKSTENLHLCQIVIDKVVEASLTLHLSDAYQQTVTVNDIQHLSKQAFQATFFKNCVPVEIIT